MLRPSPISQMQFLCWALMLACGLPCCNPGKTSLPAKLHVPDVGPIFDGMPTARDIANWFEGVKCDPQDQFTLTPFEADVLLFVSTSVGTLMSMFADEDPGIDRALPYWKMMETNWPDLTEAYDKQYDRKNSVSVMHFSVVMASSAEWSQAIKRLKIEPPPSLKKQLSAMPDN